MKSGDMIMLELNGNFVYRKIFDVNLLVPIRKNDISNDTLSLNTTAGLIIQECSKAKDSDALALLLSEKFIDVNKEEIYLELKSYIENLISTGILIKR